MVNKMGSNMVINSNVINTITSGIKEGYFQLDGSTYSLVGNIYRSILQLLREKELNDLYGSITEGIIPPSLLIGELSVLLNTTNDIFLNWILEGFPCKYMDEDGVI